MCFNKVEGPKTLRRHTLVKNSITQITEDFIKKIGEIFKESEKLYKTEKKSNHKHRFGFCDLSQLTVKAFYGICDINQFSQFCRKFEIGA